MKKRKGPCRSSPRKARGFSLVELSIVVVLMSIMLTLGIAAFSAQMDNSAYSATQRKQEVIKDALIAYLRANKRLPCPETTGLPGTPMPPLGRENRQGTTGTPAQPDPTTICSSYVGTLPWLDLGLAKEIAFDGYGNFFSYFVAMSKDGTDSDWTLTQRSDVPGFNVGNPGRFAIWDKGTETGKDSNGYALPALAAVVLVSHGKNGFGAVTEKGTRLDQSSALDPDEKSNIPITSTTNPAPLWMPPATAPMTQPPQVTASLYSSSTSVDFDDVVMVLRPNDLLTLMIKDGTLKSSQAQINESFSRIKSALASYAFATNGSKGGGSCDADTGPYCRLLPYPAKIPATGTADNSIVSGIVSGYVPWADPALIAAGLTQADVIDPWGKPIRYEVDSKLAGNGSGYGLSVSLPSASTAYRLFSDGPDRTSKECLATFDDICVTVSTLDLRQMIGLDNLARTPTPTPTIPTP